MRPGSLAALRGPFHVTGRPVQAERLAARVSALGVRRTGAQGAMENNNLREAAGGVALHLGPMVHSHNPSPRAVIRLTSGSATQPTRQPPYSVFIVLVVTLLVLLIAATFLWNLLVLVTILRVRAFYRVPHNLVASTAVSDMLVAALVMPLSLATELSDERRWRLGRSLCHVWSGPPSPFCAAPPASGMWRRSPWALLDHHAPPAVHAAHPQPSFCADDLAAHLGALSTHRSGGATR